MKITSLQSDPIKQSFMDNFQKPRDFFAFVIHITATNGVKITAPHF